MDTPLIGSLVVASPKYRDTMGTGEGAAILLALRRGSGKLFYPDRDRTFWVPTNEVRAIPAAAVPEDSLERLLSDLLLFLNAEESNLEAYEGDRATIAIETAELTGRKLRELRWLYRGRIVEVDFSPRNMSRITLMIRLAHLPAPAGAGT